MRKFSKMHGAGNDFIVADDWCLTWPRHAGFIQQICDRKRGIGADGFILLSAPSSSHTDITMSFFNCDGKPAEMCGNGLRCAALFTKLHILNQTSLKFDTGSGILDTEIINSQTVTIEIPIKKQPEAVILEEKECCIVNTGVPHLILFCKDIAKIDIEKEGKKFRNHNYFQPEGTNVDFIAVPETPNIPVSIRTYERGVEGETAACGTGIAAAAIALAMSYKLKSPIKFMTSHSDTITVDFCHNDNIVDVFNNIFLTGPAIEVYTGIINDT